MLSLEHPAIHLYSGDKDKIKVMVRNGFKDMLGEWTLERIDEEIRENPRHFITFNLLERQVLIKILECEDVNNVLMRKRGVVITKKSQGSWKEALKVIDWFFQTFLLKPRI